MSNIAIIAADDHEIFLQGLKSLFAGNQTISLVDTCNNGNDLIGRIQLLSPQLVLLDLSMPGASVKDILEVTRPINTSIIILTMNLDAQLANGLVTQGVSGYVLKESAFEELEFAINQVISGEVYLSPLLLESMNNSLESNLTAREIEILQLAAEGISNKEIACDLAITERTIRFHFSNICLKLGASNRSNAIAKSLKLHLIDII
ncbi:MAG: response regulator transcription factor [Oleispira antarctica]|nr:response regulator transcription factor [Oleispira antarctica]MBQ0791670.1 response regulator transcription factor [Oleispira antarctica]